jgi:hypothetical protein
MNQGPRWVLLIFFYGCGKSRATVPLKEQSCYKKKHEGGPSLSYSYENHKLKLYYKLPIFFRLPPA